MMKKRIKLFWKKSSFLYPLNHNAPIIANTVSTSWVRQACVVIAVLYLPKDK